MSPTSPIRLALALVALVITAGHSRAMATAGPVYVGPSGRYDPSVAITLRRGDVKNWSPKDGQVSAYCFFRAANLAHADGRWFAINGISRGRLGRFWVEEAGQRQPIEDEDNAPESLRDFLYSVNDKMNDACP